MARIVLITGGSRSGKSRFAQTHAESLAGTHGYIATCPRVDVEMDDRILRHQKEREGRGWLTREEELDLPGIIRSSHDCDVLLIDCLTLWINNLLFHASDTKTISEETIRTQTEAVLAACHEHHGTIFFVTNEVGYGIIPDNPLARQYRDLAGRCNQTMAAGADVVIMVACGCPLMLKGTL